MWFIAQLGGSVDPAFTGAPIKETRNRNDLAQYPSRPATDLLRDLIDKFRGLEYIPGGLYGNTTWDVRSFSLYHTPITQLINTHPVPPLQRPIHFLRLALELQQHRLHHRPNCHRRSRKPALLQRRTPPQSPRSRTPGHSAQASRRTKNRDRTPPHHHGRPSRAGGTRTRTAVLRRFRGTGD